MIDVLPTFDLHVDTLSYYCERASSIGVSVGICVGAGGQLPPLSGEHATGQFKNAFMSSRPFLQRAAGFSATHVQSFDGFSSWIHDSESHKNNVPGIYDSESQVSGSIMQQTGVGVGATVGSSVGAAEGADVGADVGVSVGAAVGKAVGAGVGISVGAAEGAYVGAGVGVPVGAAKGKTHMKLPWVLIQISGGGHG